jgi:hypothetical protein
MLGQSNVCQRRPGSGRAQRVGLDRKTIVLKEPVERESNDLMVLLSVMLRFHKAVHQLSALASLQNVLSNCKSFQLSLNALRGNH